MINEKFKDLMEQFVKMCGGRFECEGCPYEHYSHDDECRAAFVYDALTANGEKCQNLQKSPLEAVRRRIVDAIARVEGMQKGLDHALTFVNEAIWELDPVANDPAKHAEGGKDE